MKKTYRFIQETELGEVKEISTTNNFAETLSFEELLGMFRQYIIMLGYDDESVKRIIMVDEDDLDLLNIEEEDLGIYDWDNILR